MGSCFSSRLKFVVDEAVIGRNNESFEYLQSLGLKLDDLNFLFTAFSDIDADGSNTIRFDELFGYLSIDDTPCNKKIFNFLTNKKEIYLTFLEFCVVTWNFLTVSENDMGRFTFVLFDEDNSGFLQAMEVVNLIKTIYPNHEKYRAVSELISKVYQGNRDNFSLNDFAKWTKDHLSLLQPLMTLQAHIKKQIIGDSFWNYLATVRMDLESKNILDLHDIAAETRKIKLQQIVQIKEANLAELRANELKAVQKLKKKFKLETLEKLHLVESQEKVKPGMTLTENPKVSDHQYQAILADIDNELAPKNKLRNVNAYKDKEKSKSGKEGVESNHSKPASKSSKHPAANGKHHSHDHDGVDGQTDVADGDTKHAHSHKHHKNDNGEEASDGGGEDQADFDEDVIHVAQNKRRRKSIIKPLLVRVDDGNSDKNKKESKSKSSKRSDGKKSQQDANNDSDAAKIATSHGTKSTKTSNSKKISSSKVVPSDKGFDNLDDDKVE